MNAVDTVLVGTVCGYMSFKDRRTDKSVMPRSVQQLLNAEAMLQHASPAAQYRDALIKAAHAATNSMIVVNMTMMCAADVQRMQLWHAVALTSGFDWHDMNKSFGKLCSTTYICSNMPEMVAQDSQHIAGSSSGLESWPAFQDYVRTLCML